MKIDRMHTLHVNEIHNLLIDMFDTASTDLEFE